MRRARAIGLMCPSAEATTLKAIAAMAGGRFDAASPTGASLVGSYVRIEYMQRNTHKRSDGIAEPVYDPLPMNVKSVFE
jgi:hypothetical protein